MIKNNNNLNNNKKENCQINELLLDNNNNLSSGEKRVITIQSNCPRLILDSLNNIKYKNMSKRKSQSKYNALSNYSFSNSGNELSKKNFETLEKNTIDIEEEISKKKIIKDVPIYINYSDYYYCPDSIKEKNLNVQIMKYLYENNLIANPKKDIFNNKKNKKIKKNKSFNLEKKPIILKNDDNPIINIKYKNSKAIHNDNGKVIDTQKSNSNIQNYINENKKYKINNIEIKYINNLYKTNNNIFSIKTRNNIDKPKEKFYSFRTGKTIDANNVKTSSNKNFFDDSSSSNKKKVYFKKIKNKSGKSLIPFDTKKYNKKLKSKINNNYGIKEKIDKENIKDYKEDKKAKKSIFEISSNVVNEQFIDEKVNKNKINDSSDLMRISLQSINDSKMMELADNYIPKDEEFEKLKAFDLINKRKIV